jgi:D-3-phosphoglycerate dehydrogenase
VAEKLHRYLEEGSTTLSVNLRRWPSPAADHAPPGHLHRNVPGVLAEVNSILAEHSVNVEGQLLGTRGEYGYLLTDIAVDYSAEVLARCGAMSQTIRLRVLS